MSNRTATLYLRVTTKDGKALFCQPVYLSKGRLKPHYAMVSRQPEHHPEGVYYVRFGRESRKQKFLPVGNDPYVALDKLAEKGRWLRTPSQQRRCETSCRSSAWSGSQAVALRMALYRKLDRFATGGRGSGGNNDPLESQGLLTLSQDHSLQFAVNAGSGSISVFSVHGSRLSLVDKVISGGSEPDALAQHGNLMRATCCMLLTGRTAD